MCFKSTFESLVEHLKLKGQLNQLWGSLLGPKDVLEGLKAQKSLTGPASTKNNREERHFLYMRVSSIKGRASPG